MFDNLAARTVSDPDTFARDNPELMAAAGGYAPIAPARAPLPAIIGDDDGAPIDWGKWEDDVDENGNFNPAIRNSTSPYAKTVKFPCEKCAGTGRYGGVRFNQPKSHCFACGGKGYFMTSEAERRQARQQRAVKKALTLQEYRTAFDAQYPGLAAFIADAARWSAFAASLNENLTTRGTLSEKQVAAAQSMRAKSEQRRAEKAKAREANKKEIDLTPIRTMFETAINNGKKLPIYRAAGLVINRAPDHGKNPGALYVKTTNGEYLGKVLGTIYMGKPAPGLEAIAADPKGEAIAYGKETGICSCCGATLTNEESKALGIGPICARKWGLL